MFTFLPSFRCTPTLQLVLPRSVRCVGERSFRGVGTLLPSLNPMKRVAAGIVLSLSWNLKGQRGAATFSPWRHPFCKPRFQFDCTWSVCAVSVDQRGIRVRPTRNCVSATCLGPLSLSALSGSARFAHRCTRTKTALTTLRSCFLQPSANQSRPGGQRPFW